MADYYASTAIPEGTTGAGTIGDPTNIRHAIGTLAAVAGDRVYFKDAGSAWTLNVANGSLTAAVPGTSDAPVRVLGYTTTVGDGGRPEIAASANTTDLILADEGWVEWCNLILTGGTRAVHSNGTSLARGITFTNVWMRNQTTACVDTAGHTNEPFVFYGCTFSGAPIGLEVGGRDAIAIGCYAIDCSTAGFQVANNNKGAKLVRCLAHDCGIGFDLGNQEAWLDHCVANRCTTGIDIGGVGRYMLIHCGIVNNTTGVDGVAGARAQFWNCGTYGNTTDVGANVTLEHDVGRATGDPDMILDNPESPLDVNVELNAGSAWRGAGTDDQLGVMGQPDIGLVFSSPVSQGPPGSRINVVVGRS